MIGRLIIPVIIGVVLIGVLIPLSSVQEDDNTLDVVIIDGQSNAQYWGWAANNFCNPDVVNASGLDAPEHNLYYYGDSTPTYYGRVYTEPSYDTTLESYDLHLMYDNNEWKIGGYGPVLASELSNRSGHDVLIIDVGVGAAPIQWLTTTGAGGVYAERVITDALHKIPAGYHPDVLGMVWAQGEADRNTPVDTYKEKFELLFNDLSDKFGVDKVYIIKTRGADTDKSIIAQNQLVEENDNIIMATTITDSFTTENGYLGNDNLHYTQAGRSLIASEISGIIEYEDHQEIVGADMLELVPLLAAAGLVIMAALTIGRRAELF